MGESDAMSEEPKEPDKNDKIKCKICCETVDKRSLKCSTQACSVFVHRKCFENVSKWFMVDSKNWRCRVCCEGPRRTRLGSTTVENNSNECTILRKEIDCLSREKELINTIAAEREYTIQVLKKRMGDMESKYGTLADGEGMITRMEQKHSNIPTISYSDVVKTNNSPYLIIKSVDSNVSPNKIEYDIKSKCSPGAVNIEIKNTKVTKNGFLIACKDKDDLNILKQNLVNTIGEKYQVYDQKKINPTIMIKGVPSSYLNSDGSTGNASDVLIDSFIKSLIYDNKLEEDENNIKVVKTFTLKFSLNVILNVSPSVYCSLMNKGYVYIGWIKCQVCEHFNIVRCFNCCRFGHLSKNCRNKPVCQFCAGDHISKNCTTDINKCCPNCKFHNEKYKTNWDMDHSASDRICNFYKSKVGLLKSKINYV